MKNLIVFMAILALTLLGSAGIANADSATEEWYVDGGIHSTAWAMASGSDEVYMDFHNGSGSYNGTTRITSIGTSTQKGKFYLRSNGQGGGVTVLESDNAGIAMFTDGKVALGTTRSDEGALSSNVGLLFPTVAGGYGRPGAAILNIQGSAIEGGSGGNLILATRKDWGGDITERMRIGHMGNVTIGPAYLGAELDVAGEIYADDVFVQVGTDPNNMVNVKNLASTFDPSGLQGQINALWLELDTLINDMPKGLTNIDRSGSYGTVRP